MEMKFPCRQLPCVYHGSGKCNYQNQLHIGFHARFPAAQINISWTTHFRYLRVVFTPKIESGLADMRDLLELL
jgi:hypothetical protein